MNNILVRTSFLSFFLVLLFPIGMLAQGAGDALSFNGNAQWVDMQNFQTFPSTGFVIECWISLAGPNETSGNQSFVGDIGGDYQLGADASRHPLIDFGNAASRIDSSFTFALNTWYHCALVGSQNADSTLHADLYVDGVVIFSVNSSVKTFAECNWLRIGDGENGNFTNGTVDEVRFWNGARTAQQIRENMHLTVAGSSANLLGYWRMDNGSGTSVTDLTGNGNDGVFTDTPAWIASKAPLGAGSSNTEEAATGELTFAGTNLDMFIGLLGVVPGTPIVVTQITSMPAGTAISYPNLNIVYPNYWIVETYVNGGAANPLAQHGNLMRSVSALELERQKTPFTASTVARFTFVLGPGNISSSDAATPKNLKLFTRSDTGTGSWTKIDSGAFGSTDSVTFNGVTVFSNQFAVGSTGNSPLPIEISSLKEQTTDGGVQIQWSTESETDNYGFYVQRRTDANKTYTTVSGLIPGAGTSLVPHNYDWTDNNVAAGVYYYRLEQVNLDGDVSFSTEIKVVFGVESVMGTSHPHTFALAQNYPNPFNPSTNIGYSLAARSLVSLKVFNLLGQVVAELVNREQPAGEYRISWMANVPSGVYFYKLEAVTDAQAGAGFSAVKKLIVLK